MSEHCERASRNVKSQRNDWEQSFIVTDVLENVYIYMHCDIAMENQSRVPAIIAANGIMLGISTLSITARLYARCAYLRLSPADGKVKIHLICHI